VVRRQDNGDYCVWDKKTEGVAQIANRKIRCENLEFNQALDEAMELNGSGRAANASGLNPSKKP
jgi:hypothetical protein